MDPGTVELLRRVAGPDKLLQHESGATVRYRSIILFHGLFLDDCQSPNYIEHVTNDVADIISLFLLKVRLTS